MKFYSETLNKLFESEEDLKTAEKAAKEKKEKEAAKKAIVSKEKKASAEAIKAAELELDKAQEKFRAARKEAQEIIEKANDEANVILREASKEVSAAQEKRYEVVKAFNEKYGPYTTSYTGEKAYNEWKKAVEQFNNFFNYFF